MQHLLVTLLEQQPHRPSHNTHAHAAVTLAQLSVLLCLGRLHLLPLTGNTRAKALVAAKAPARQPA
jgi:hypothetical protein